MTAPFNLKHAKLAYQFFINHYIALILIPIIAFQLVHHGVDDLVEAARSALNLDPHIVLCSSFVAIFVSTVYFMSRPQPVYIVDYACFKPLHCYRVPFASFLEHSRSISYYTEKTTKFQMYILERSGLGEETNLPPAIHCIPPMPSMQKAREEAELVIFSAVDDLFAKTGLRSKDIDILIVNCSLFSPTPSLSAMIVNKYKLRSNIRSFNLSGMGCSAGLISIDLARDLLQVGDSGGAEYCPMVS